MVKLPLSEIMQTIKGSQGSARPGVTRRAVLKSAADQAMPKGDSIEDIMAEAELASGFFKQHPDLWDPSWGPLEEAEPEDLAHAMSSILEALRGGG